MRGAGRGFFGLMNGRGQRTWLVSGSSERARRVRMAAGMNSCMGRFVAWTNAEARGSQAVAVVLGMLATRAAWFAAEGLLAWTRMWDLMVGKVSWPTPASTSAMAMCLFELPKEASIVL